MARNVNAIFVDIDACDADRFVSHLTPDAVFTFGNAEPVVGHDDIAGAVRGFFASVDGVTHHLLEVYELGDTVIVKADVEYVRKDGTHVAVPNADILEFEGDLVRSWQIYIDVAPVYA